jgi:cyanophycinase-like exopeptidase
MALRAISFSELELALADFPSYRDKTGAEIYVKKLNNYTLIVIAEKMGDILKVITVYKARKVDKLIRSKLRKGLWMRLK